jgi:hypothetical protein
MTQTDVHGYGDSELGAESMASAKTGVNVAFIGNADKTKTHSVSAKKVSAQEQQYKEAIAMSSAELGAAITEPTKRITKHVGHAVAHQAKAKMERDKAQAEFSDNIAYYYEAKQRLLNPGYRIDVDNGEARTPDENRKTFGAPDWATFVANCAAYSLQHADRLLKQFAKSNGLLTDDGNNIDDPEEGEVGPAGSGGRNTKDVTAQKRYEHIATAAMEIASRNPEGEVEKQIFAAAAYVPAPLMPLPPDIYSEALSFITMIASSASDENVKADAKKLVCKMLRHKPAPDPTKILAEATPEEKRKRNKRLEKKNRQPLGSTIYKPASPGTSEQVQRLELTTNAGAGTIQAGCNSESDPYPGSIVTAPPADDTKSAAPSPVVVAGLIPEVGSLDSEFVAQAMPLTANKATLCPPVLKPVEENPRNAPADSTEHSAPRLPLNMVWSELKVGKRYEVRPAPRGGHGVYEPGSPVLLRSYATEEDAWDALDALSAISVGA